MLLLFIPIYGSQGAEQIMIIVHSICTKNEWNTKYGRIFVHDIKLLFETFTKDYVA